MLARLFGLETQRDGLYLKFDCGGIEDPGQSARRADIVRTASHIVGEEYQSAA